MIGACPWWVDSDVADVVVVGGGIAGSSLAYGLASEGLGVVVLEATKEFPDRVRGESMHVWGVLEARRLGVEEVLLSAGAHIAPVWKQYVEHIGEAGQIPVGSLIPDVAGTLNLRHPDACQALIDAAGSAGATIVRGVHDVKLSGSGPTTVTYAVDGRTATVQSPLVVGADGRNSSVRRQTGITLQRQEPMNYISGLLVDGLLDVPDDHDVMVSEGDLFFVMFHQGGGRARVYLIPGLSGQHRFSGPEGTRRFLDACRASAYPWAEGVAAGRPAGPCATYPGDDTWTDTPFTEGVVLIGDAAGHNDPIIGEGLSIALRDARIVRDLVLDHAHGVTDFSPYGAERAERMARLRFIADLISVSQAEDADNRQARRLFVGERMATMDAEVFPLIVGAFAGPDSVPAELFDPTLLERIRSA